MSLSENLRIQAIQKDLLGGKYLDTFSNSEGTRVHSILFQVTYINPRPRGRVQWPTSGIRTAKHQDYFDGRRIRFQFIKTNSSFSELFSTSHTTNGISYIIQCISHQKTKCMGENVLPISHSTRTRFITWAQLIIPRTGIAITSCLTHLTPQL